MTDPAASAGDGSMREAARHGGRWAMLENFGTQAVSTVMTLVLARLVAPDEFGIIAIVTVVLNFVTLVTQFGLSASLIQRDDVTADDRHTIFWASAVTGIILGGLGVAFAGPLAGAFEGEQAAPYIAVMVAALPLNLTGAFFRAILVRELRFRPVAVTSALATVGQAVVAIGLAWFFDAGAWAIVAGRLFRRVATTGVWAVQSGYRPRLRLDFSRFREHLSFNAGWGAGSIATYFVKNVDYWFVARALGEAQLGIYYLAYVLPDLVRLRILALFQSALLPVLSRIREDRARFRAAYLEIVQIVALVAFPAMVGLALVAGPLAEVGLSNKFIDAAGPMAFIAVASGLDAIWHVVATALSADGVPGKAVIVVLARLAVLYGGLVWLVPDRGLTGAGIAVLAGAVVAAVLGHWRASRQFGISGIELGTTLLPVVVPVLAMSGVVWSLDLALVGFNAPALVRLLVLPAFGAVTYVGVLRVAHRPVYGRLVTEGKRFFIPTKA